MKLQMNLDVRGKKVVLGGYHPTAMPDEALQHADSIVLGMAEASWPKLLDDFEKGKLKSIYIRDTNYDIANIPPIRRNLSNIIQFMERYNQQEDAITGANFVQ